MHVIACLAAASMLPACAEERPGIPAPEHSLQFPVGIAVHPAGYALVTCSNFDLRYERASLRVIDLAGIQASDLSQPDPDDPYLERFILDEVSVGLDNFGAAVVLSSDGTQAAVSVRETNQIILLDVDAGPDSIELNCWTSERRPDEPFPMCDGARYVMELEADDPFDIQLVDHEDGSRSAYVTFLRGTAVEVWDVPVDEEGLPGLKYELDTEVLGTNDIAISPTTGMAFVTSRFPDLQTNPIFYFDTQLGSDAEVHEVNLFQDLLGNETRGAEFAADGLTLALLIRDPDMLIFMDTQPGDDGRPSQRFLGEVVVGNQPSLLRRKGEIFFVTCAQDDAIYAIDGVKHRLISAREDICKGPYDIAFWDHDDVQWGLVTCFEEDTLAIVDVDPSSAGFLDVVARVGEPVDRSLE